MNARYEGYTNTIRRVPQNYCLIHWDNEGNVRFDMDGATKDYRSVIEEAYKAWELLYSYNDKNSLVWLVNEYIVHEGI